MDLLQSDLARPARDLLERTCLLLGEDPEVRVALWRDVRGKDPCLAQLLAHKEMDIRRLRHPTPQQRVETVERDHPRVRVTNLLVEGAEPLVRKLRQPTRSLVTAR